jgi:tetratricopeptide (TPR) repeat protein
MRCPFVLPLALFTCALVMVGAAPSYADTSDKKAAHLFDESIERYRQGRFQEAIDLLKQAYALKPAPVLLYDLARAYEGLGDTDGALDAYRAYLRDDPTAKDRGGIEVRIATLQRQHDEREARLHAAATPITPSPPPAEAPPAHRASPVPWVLVGVGAAGIGAGAVLGILARARHDDALAESAAMRATDLQSNAQHFATAANVAFVMGGALAIGGLVWGIVDRTSAEGTRQSGVERRARVAASPGSLAVLWNF